MGRPYCTTGLVSLSALLALALAVALAQRRLQALQQAECGMTFSYPSYAPVNVTAAAPGAFPPGYALQRYHNLGSREALCGSRLPRVWERCSAEPGGEAAGAAGVTVAGA